MEGVEELSSVLLECSESIDCDCNVKSVNLVE